MLIVHNKDLFHKYNASINIKYIFTKTCHEHVNTVRTPVKMRLAPVKYFITNALVHSLSPSFFHGNMRLSLNFSIRMLNF